tara:strand:- start:963 stop:1142 length:180 start_codon:yes stop_codon:yes gene_type:complete
MNLSIIIPLLNEEESLEELFSRIDLVCKTDNLSYEIWFWQALFRKGRMTEKSERVLTFF